MNKKTKLILIILVLILANFLLVPRHWEPGGETWRQWASATIMQEEGGFPVLSGSPLYILYLQIFSVFEYPLAVQIEFIITHLLASLALFFFLRNYIKEYLAMFLTIAWAPFLGILEGSAGVMAIGFFLLYLMPGKSLYRNEGFFPPALLAAGLCHSVFLIFLIFHILGEIYKATKNKFSFEKHPSIFLKSFLILIFALVVLYPSDHYHNHMLMDPTYSPISLESPFEIGFFQIGNDGYVKTNYPKEEWIYKDWYFTQEESYGGASSFFEALIAKPKTILINMFREMAHGIQAPAFFYLGAFAGPLSAFLWLIFLLGAIGYLTNEKYFSKICSITLGTLAVFAIFSLTKFNDRYIILLMPCALLFMMHFADGLKFIMNLNKGHKKKLLLLIGIFFILAGVTLNQWTIATFLAPNKIFSASLTLQILLFNVFFTAAGFLLILKRKNLARIKLKIEKEKITKYLVIVSAIMLLLNFNYTGGLVGQMNSVVTNQGFLSGRTPVSFADSYEELFANVDENTKILTLEDRWVKAFGPVDINHVYQAANLPPYSDDVEFLSEIDQIWVSNYWSKNEASTSTQSYLRYLLHIKPIISNMTAKQVEGYGVVYS